MASETYSARSARAWRLSNPEKVKLYRVKNKERDANFSKKYRLDNIDRERERKSAYRRNNKIKRCLYEQKRRARKTGADDVSEQDILDLKDKQKNRCPECRTSISKKSHIDHIMPLARGGRHEIGNIQLLCPTCNMRKNAKDPIDWANENGRLL